MGFSQIVTPSLPCPYCLEVRSTHLPDAAWVDGQGSDPDTTLLEIHMADCEAKDDPATDGFVAASEVCGRTSAGLGLCEQQDNTESEVLTPQ